ncbi:TIGR04222 domain-containing membrane protein [Actinocorallia sp. A-T 12471]|uniref:TIGR04222 domain-containing membrane protein n=1 Tax=Actinocorallia sp. A-T 12471 TaxID=3089813 RepID=UPI0029CC9531|nr:TIGR04222 domain-containing membrane protein [Actinocorallia sp. A-T 12471]MDX6743178.1 TIGR04222 domain-containing membrane protein [Actinocorallia sp. A-T 12471]
MFFEDTSGSGATWGIEGPAFLALYVLLGILVIGFVLGLRRWLAAGTDLPGDMSAPELAYLAGGERRAIAASLAALRLSGSVASAPGGKVIATGPAPVGAAPLDHAVLYAAGAGTRSNQLLRNPAVAQELRAVRAALVARGQLLGPAERRITRLTALPIILLVVLGIARLIAGLDAGRPVGFLVAALVFFGLVMIVLLSSAPHRTRAANRTVTMSQQRYQGLHPGYSPSYADHGPHAAALAVAVFGGIALMGMDPVFAAEAEVDRLAQATATGSAGSSYTDSSSGYSDSGSSDSSSSSDSGSSCGGGGGCGGGGCGG